MNETLPATLEDTRSQLLRLVADSLPSPASKKAYAGALERFFTWFEGSGLAGFTRATVLRYRAELIASGLAPATINQHLSAIRRLAQEGADNGLMPTAAAAAITRVKGIRREGVRAGNWLTVDQAEQLLSSPDGRTLAGKRQGPIPMNRVSAMP